MMYTRRARLKQEAEEEQFKFSKVFTAFTSLPRVSHLVWSTSPLLTLSMALISLVRGITPAITALITKWVIDSVVLGISTHSVSPIWLPVGLQLAMSLLDRLLSTVSNTTQQLLQERVSNRVQLMILEKANTLDLEFFEDSEFYDKLRHASEESNYKPVTMISQTFDLLRTTITLFSMVFLLLQLAWWLAIIALIVPIPSFIASTRYGWIGYQRRRRQSPERRMQHYFNHVMTVDHYNKEIKLFNLGEFFIAQYRHLAEKFYEESKQILTRRYTISFLWSSLSVAANSGIYLYVALQAVLGR
ncbi:MAG: ABC transporter ATP-binding protein, partial [Ktedonobacteraceae bacterium]|nr:ABC transporter ATP-binding protein [Ktedonobacteraceae bacterium]